MKEEFKKLMGLLTQHQEGKQINLDQLLKASTAFFNDLKTSFLTAESQDKEEILKMVNDMYASMVAQAKQISKNTGMTQDQITEYVQNPDNFSPEQWKMMQETRERIAASSKDISEYLRGAAQQAENLKSSSAASAQKEGKKKPSARPKKDKWMKS